MDNETQYALSGHYHPITKNTKLLDTQLRIHHRFYHTQAQLQKWGLSDTSGCLSCEAQDDIPHHFMHCKPKELFWKTLKIWKRHIIRLDINESVLDILLGIENPNHDLYIDVSLKNPKLIELFDELM